MDDPYLSSSPSINEEEIDFQYVYALRTFVATEKGQANVYKGDSMVLLNDSNSYWWLVRLVKDSTVGFLPAEHVETPSERLARLNKHRNGDVSSPASFSYSAQIKDLGSDSEGETTSVRLPNSRLKKARGRGKSKLKKSVTFTQTLTYVSASEYDATDDDFQENEYYEYSDFEESDEELGQQHEEHLHEQQKAQGGVQQPAQDTVSIANQDALVIRKPRSNSNSPQSSNSNIVTNSDDEGSGAVTDARREENDDTKKTSGVLSLISRNMNRKTSGLSNSSTIASEEGGAANSVSAHLRQISNETVQSMDSVIHHPISPISPDGSQKRRSLLQTKSSTEQLKRKPSTGSTASTPSQVSTIPASAPPINSITGLFKRNGGKQPQMETSAAPTQDASTSSSSSSRSSPSSTHSQSSSTTSPDITDPQQRGLKVEANATRVNGSESIAKIFQNGGTRPLNTNSRVRSSMYETRTEQGPSTVPLEVTRRGRLNVNTRQTHSEIFSNNPFRASMASELDAVTAPLSIIGSKGPSQRNPIQPLDYQQRNQFPPGQSHPFHPRSQLQESSQLHTQRAAPSKGQLPNQTIPLSHKAPAPFKPEIPNHNSNHAGVQLAAYHSTPVLTSSYLEQLETPDAIDRSDAVSSTLSLPLSISSDREMRSGSAATVSTSPSSPMHEQMEQVHDKIERMSLGKEEAGYMSTIMASEKIHPDIVPIYKETSVRLDKMNQVSFAILLNFCWMIANKYLETRRITDNLPITSRRVTAIYYSKLRYAMPFSTVSFLHVLSLLFFNVYKFFFLITSLVYFFLSILFFFFSLWIIEKVSLNCGCYRLGEYNH